MSRCETNCDHLGSARVKVAPAERLHSSTRRMALCAFARQLTRIFITHGWSCIRDVVMPGRQECRSDWTHSIRRKNKAGDRAVCARTEPPIRRRSRAWTRMRRVCAWHPCRFSPLAAPGLAASIQKPVLGAVLSSRKPKVQDQGMVAY